MAARGFCEADGAAVRNSIDVEGVSVPWGDYGLERGVYGVTDIAGFGEAQAAGYSKDVSVDRQDRSSEGIHQDTFCGFHLHAWETY